MKKKKIPIVIRGWWFIISTGLALGLFGVIYSLIRKENYLILKLPYPPIIANIYITIIFIVDTMILYGIKKNKRVGYYGIIVWTLAVIIGTIMDSLSFSSVPYSIFSIIWIFLISALWYGMYKERKYFGIN